MIKLRLRFLVHLFFWIFYPIISFASPLVVRIKTQDQKIKVIPIEQYVASVLTHEMPSTWPMEALKAQAVAIRSYTVAKLNENRHKNFDVVATTMDQVYRDAIAERAAMAVNETTSSVLKNIKGQVLKAFYHSDCGGKTIEANQVWTGSENTGVAIDPFCGGRQSNKWTFKLSLGQVLKSLRLGPEELAQVRNAKISVNELGDIEFDQKILIGSKELTVQELRKTWGFNRLKSTPQQIQTTQNHMIFKGQGWGHRVGLCQHGARDWALMGYNSQQILSHYYPKATITSEVQMLARQ